jgi:hypothetical protein
MDGETDGEAHHHLIVGCVRCTTSSKRKGPGDSFEMPEGHPLRLHQQALPIILFSNDLIAHGSRGSCSSVSSVSRLQNNYCGKLEIQLSAHL